MQHRYNPHGEEETSLRSWIHFGAAGYEDYTTHQDPQRRAAYRRRHAGILLADGRPAYLGKTSPAFWAFNLL